MKTESLQEGVVNELLTKPIKSSAETAFLAGVIKGAGNLTLSLAGFGVEIESCCRGLIATCVDIISARYGDVSVEASEKDLGMRSFSVETLVVSSKVAAPMLRECGIVADKYELIAGIPQKIVSKTAAKVAFLRGLYLSCGTLSVPQEETGEDVGKGRGYHMEFMLKSDAISDDLIKLIDALCEYEGGFVRRRKKGNVYIKSSQAISDCLAAMGASEAVLSLQSIVVSRQVKNDVNRGKNLIMANINKSTDAAIIQSKSISDFVDKYGMDVFSEKQAETIRLRLEYPGSGIEELASLSDPPTSKSGMNHRLRRIMEIIGEQKD